jgi:hypothetical protein
VALDLTSLIGDTEPGGDARAMAMRRLGMLGQLSGDRVLSPVGQGLEEEAQREVQLRAQRAQQERQLAMQQAQLQRQAANDAATARYHNAMAGAAEQRAGSVEYGVDPFGNKYVKKTPGKALSSTPPAGGSGPGPAPGGAPGPTTSPAPAPGGPLRKPAGGPAPAPGPLTGADAIAQAIIDGKQPPETKGLFRAGAAVREKLAQKGFDLSAAQTEWTATQRHLATLNGQQQERLRQAIDFTTHSLDKIDELYNRWQQVGPASGYRMLNKAALSAAKQGGGEAGAVAQALEAQINDLTAEMANVYMGGNSPTDHALSLAKENLSADWNEKTFKTAIDQARKNLILRRNAMLTAPVAGLPGGSRYNKAPEPAEPAKPPAFAPASAPPALRQVKTREEAMALPKGTHFLDPNGVERVR